MPETRGVLLFNRGDKCVIRAIVALYTLRKHWQGDVTFFLEDPYPHEFDEVCKYFNVNIVHCEQNHNVKALVRKTELFINSPYDRTLWIDADTIVVGPIDEMFDYLDDNDVAIPHFSGWWSDGKTICRRIKGYTGLTDAKYIEEAIKHHPAINTGILSYRRGLKFMEDWIELARKGDGKMFIPDEVAFQVLYPSYPRIFIAPQKFNVSVRFGNNIEDKRIIHYHGQKHVLEFKLCNLWKQEFKEMCNSNIANINSFLKYADKRLNRYLKGEIVHGGFGGEVVDPLDEIDDPNAPDTTIVTACDEYYVDILRETFPNWRKYKNIDGYPVIVFVYGIPIEDARLDFLKLPNVTIVPWKMENAENHREEMLSAFVFGTAENVRTTYWLKLDADSYATNNTPFITDEMKVFAFCGHKWGYSRPDHIRKLDEWARGHWKKKLRKAKPMIEEGTINGTRFFHNAKRTISFIQLHKTQFTRFCVKLLRERKLPAPTQDTFMFYVANRFNPKSVGVMNFKKRFGFTQGKGKLGAEYIRNKVMEVENNQVVEEKNSEEIEEVETKIEAPIVSKIEVAFEPVTQPITIPTSKILIDIPDYAKIPFLAESKTEVKPNKNEPLSSFYGGRKFKDSSIEPIIEIIEI